jgi:hypothetical protein
LLHFIDANFPKQSSADKAITFIPIATSVFCQRSMSRDSEVAAKRKDTDTAVLAQYSFGR